MAEKGEMSPVGYRWLFGISAIVVIAAMILLGIQNDTVLESITVFWTVIEKPRFGWWVVLLGGLLCFLVGGNYCRGFLNKRVSVSLSLPVWAIVAVAICAIAVAIW